MDYRLAILLILVVSACTAWFSGYRCWLLAGASDVRHSLPAKLLNSLFVGALSGCIVGIIGSEILNPPGAKGPIQYWYADPWTSLLFKFRTLVTAVIIAPGSVMFIVNVAIVTWLLIKKRSEGIKLYLGPIVLEIAALVTLLICLDFIPRG